MGRFNQVRAPFVLTISTLSALACTSEIVFEGGSDGSGGSTSSAPSSNASTGDTSGTSGNGVGGFGGNRDGINCPAELPTGFDACPETGHPGVCSYDVPCQSGTVPIRLECTPGSFWQLVPNQTCDYAYDSCPNTELYCAEEWWMPTGTNPPSPCPAEPPNELESCFPGDWGGVHEHCGYACDGDVANGWTIASCTGSDDTYWEFDSECDP